MSLPRGDFGGRGATVALDDPFLAESYLGDPDYDRLGHSQFPSGLNQPPFSSAHSDDLGSVFGESEIDEFPVLLCLHLVLRLRHSFVVIWGTCITVRKSLPGLTRCRGDDRRCTWIFL